MKNYFNINLFKIKNFSIILMLIKFYFLINLPGNFIKDLFQINFNYLQDQINEHNKIRKLINDLDIILLDSID